MVFGHGHGTDETKCSKLVQHVQIGMFQQLFTSVTVSGVISRSVTQTPLSKFQIGVTLAGTTASS
jgi:hypothetical protein